jgi:hypothetical protein
LNNSVRINARTAKGATTQFTGTEKGAYTSVAGECRCSIEGSKTTKGVSPADVAFAADQKEAHVGPLQNQGPRTPEQRDSGVHSSFRSDLRSDETTSRPCCNRARDLEQ